MVSERGEEMRYREVGDYTFREHLVLLGKRVLALPSKMIGFKPFCLYLATWLLYIGKIDGWVWFAVMVSVLFGIVGLKVLGQMRGGSG